MKNLVATLEIKNNQLIFTVVKFLNNKPIVIFRDCIENANGWLNDDQTIKSISKTSKELKKVINKFEAQFNTEIKSVGVVLPNSICVFDENFTFDLTENSNTLNWDIYTNHKVLISQRFKEKDEYFSHKVLKTSILDIRINGQLINMNKDAIYEAENVEYEVNILTIKALVKENFIQVIKDCGIKRVSFASTEIYNLWIAAEGTKSNSNSSVIINWKENEIEAAVFMNDMIVDYQVINSGINAIINQISEKWNLDCNTAKDYLTRNIDLTSMNSKEHIWFKKTIKNNLSKTFTGKEIQEAIFELIQVEYSKIKTKLKVRTNIDVMNIHNFGLIKEIPNVEDILRKFDNFKNDYLYSTYPIGITADQIYIALGAAIYAKTKGRENENFVETKTNKTGVYIPKAPHVKPNYNYNSAIYSDNSIFIDKVKVKKR